MQEHFGYVAFGADANFWPHLFVSLYSLLVNNPQRCWHVTVICDHADDSFASNLAWLRNETGNLASVTFRTTTELGALFDRAPVMKHFTRATYYRILIGRALSAVSERVLYLDCDTVVVDSIEPLLTMEMGDAIVAAVNEFPRGQKPPTRLRVPDGVGYFNSGVMLIDLARWHANNVEERLSRYVSENAAILRSADQDALNAVLGESRREAPLRFNWQRWRLNGPVATIIHYSGPNKPWNVSDCPLPSYAYWRYRQRTPYAVPQPGWATTLRAEARTLVNRLRRSFKGFTTRRK